MTGPLPDVRLSDHPTENYAGGHAEPIERERHHVDSADARPVPVERIGNGRDGTRSPRSNGALAVMKEALGHLEWACSAIVAESIAAAETAKKLIANVKSEADAATLRARLEAQMEIADLRSMVDRLRIDLQTQRDRFQVTDEPFDTGGAEAPTCDARAQPSDARHVTGGLDFDPSDYARLLLDNIEAVYAADVASGLSPDDLVARLAGNLTYGAEVFARRLGSAAVEGTTAFDEQVTIVLQTRGDVSFGRHLAVAAYGCERLRR